MITEIGKIKIKWEIGTGLRELEKRLGEHYKNFLSAGYKKPDIKIKIEKKSFRLPSYIYPLVRTRSWEFLKYNGESYFKFHSGSLGNIDSRLKNINFYLHNRGGQLLLYLFPEILYSFILPQYHGILLHASGVKMGDKVLVFLAPPEGGKSTISKLALKKGLTLLNDDRIILREINKKFYAFGNPWHGEVEITSSEWGEVRELFFLKKAKRNSLRKISKKRMFSEILTNSFYIKEDKSNFQKIIEVIADIVNNIEGYELGFKPDERVWDFLSKKAYD
jgi:hypothetical protein